MLYVFGVSVQQGENIWDIGSGDGYVTFGVYLMYVNSAVKVVT